VHEAGWFGSVELAGAPPPAVEVVAELVRMLDVVAPAFLDGERSQVTTESGGWDLPVEVLLAHAADEAADVTVAVGADQALVAWLTTHEHVYAADGGGARPWTAVVADCVAAILRGEYEVQDGYWGWRLVRSSVVDVASGRVVSETGGLLGLLLPRRMTTVRRRRVDYGCRGAYGS
jgi:hypothetical protein